ncbi:MAG: hypothetical protein R3254_00830 [Thiomicrorhabdus sp.]|nr:hypothetical protein [Thiomicrorhabdus sp.]
MNKCKLTFPVLLFLSLYGMSSLAWAEQEETAIETFQVENNQVSPLFKTLFLSQENRKRIDKQREAYLKPPTKSSEKVIAKVEPLKGDGKPKKKRIYIPPKVAISAVIVRPDGSTIIRVNNKYNESPSKHINIDSYNASTNGVPITVNGNTQVVPVGSTLLTRKNKVVDSYKLDAQSRKIVLPKTEQKAVKNRLEEVQILNAKPPQIPQPK